MVAGDDANIYNHTQSRFDDTDINEDSGTWMPNEKISEDSVEVVELCQDHTKSSFDDADKNEDSGTSMPNEKVSEDYVEAVGLWQGHEVGQEAKELLQAVEYRYPTTFRGLRISMKELLVPALKHFHVFIKGFIETSVDALKADQITTLRRHLNEFETFGLDLSWAHQRLNMVEILKYGNDPLLNELTTLEERLPTLRETLIEGTIGFVQAHKMLEKARLEYDNATNARNKAKEVAQKFRDAYDRCSNNLFSLCSPSKKV